MKKGIRNHSKGICLLSLSLLMLLAVGCKADETNADGATAESNTISSENTEIDLDAAKQIALADAGIDENDVTFTETKSGYEYGVQIYDLNFYTSDAEYEYEIKVADGSIYSRDVDYLDGREVPAHRSNSSSSSDVAGDFDVSAEDAIQIALADAGVSESDATMIETKIDSENGQQVYDLTFYTSDAEYEYEIATSDGSICRKDVEHYHAQNDTQPSAGAQIDLARAKEIAAEHAEADMDDVTFKEAKKDSEDGADVYEIEFYYFGREYEYKIRCSDGKILEYDTD